MTNLKQLESALGKRMEYRTPGDHQIIDDAAKQMLKLAEIMSTVIEQPKKGWRK